MIKNKCVILSLLLFFTASGFTYVRASEDSKSKEKPVAEVIVLDSTTKPEPVEKAEEKPEPVFENCYQYYYETNICPKQMCNHHCPGGIYTEECEVICEPKPCFEIGVEHCPESVCQIIEGCEGKDVCFPQNDFAPPACGDLAYAGDDIECCEGLTRRCGVEFFDGTCDMAGRFSIYGVPICVPCGNGVCNQFENACNCPEDCKKNHTINIEYTPIRPKRK